MDPYQVPVNGIPQGMRKPSLSVVRQSLLAIVVGMQQRGNLYSNDFEIYRVGAMGFGKTKMVATGRILVGGSDETTMQKSGQGQSSTGQGQSQGVEAGNVV